MNGRHRAGLMCPLWLVVAVFVIVARFAEGAFLRNVPQALTQPDGTVVHLLATGDEYYNRLHDANDFTVVRDPDSGYLVYATKVDGTLRPTALVVGRSDPGTAGLERGLMPDAKTLPSPRQLFPQSMVAHALGSPGHPSFSAINNLTVFIHFADEAEFNAPISGYDTKFNSTAGGADSMRSFFAEASYGQFTISSTFYPTPSGGYVVSYADSHPRSYYKPYDATTNPGGYDKNSTTDRAQREHTLLANAINAVASQVPGSLNLDTNNDGYVDSVVFVVSGTPVSADWNNLLWPHRWYMSAGVPVIATINGKRVDVYNLLLDGNLNVGTMCHEMTHTLSAPDLYHYQTAQNGLHPVGSWDLMEYNLDPPEHMGAYMKYRYMGWIPSIPLITAPGTYSLNPLTSASNNCYRINSPNSSTDYFIVEYRRRTGTFEGSLPGSGLLVYRINSAQDGQGNAQGPPDEVYIYRPGGGLTTDGDINSAYLGVNAARPAINDSTDPSAFLSDGSPGGLVISNIGSAGNTISFDSGLGGGPSVTTIFSDSFEGSFPGSWSLWRSGTSATIEWGKVTCKSAGGSGSAWCAAGGAAPQTPCGEYVGNMNTWMKYGPFSLADALGASAEFDLWLDSETYNQTTHEGDRFLWWISVDGSNYSGYYQSGQTNGWVHKVFNFHDVTAFSAIGAQQVWFAFTFQSDAFVQGGGAYVDNVVIKKVTAAPSCAYTIWSPSHSFASSGGTGTVNVTVTSGSNCTWTATSDVSWITVTSGASGTGNGSVAFSVASNSGSARTGTLTIAGQTFTVNQDALSCFYSLSAQSASAPGAGGAGTVSVTAPPGCGWSAVSNVAWVTITSGASGTGSGTVAYSVSANSSQSQRTGTLTIAGQTFTVNQDALACSYSLNPQSASAPSVGGTGTVSVTAPTGCGWSAASNAAWITITGGAGGTGNGTVAYSVSANSSQSQRTGTLTIAGQTFTVNQAAANCSYSISPTQQSFQAVGGTGTITVTAPAGCLWTASSGLSWISVTAGASGSGTGTVNYSVQANTGSARTGTMTVAGLTLTVNEDGTGCSYSISPSTLNVGPSGGSSSLTVSTAAGCSWTAVAGSAWIQFTGMAIGFGPGVVSFIVNANPGAARSGTITVQGLTLTINQAAAGTTYTCWLPAVIHKDVPSRSAWWRSDVAVLNRSSSPTSVTLKIHAAAGTQTWTFQLAGNAQSWLPDVAGQLGITADSGALEVVSDQPIFLTGRTYSQVDPTHTYGQDYDGQEPLALLAAGQTAWLPQLTQNALYRTNIGITNTGLTTANVTVTLYNSDGSPTGWNDTRDYASGQFFQHDQPFLAGGGIDSGYAKVTVNSGSGIMAYASVIDQNTGDPTTINMKR